MLIVASVQCMQAFLKIYKQCFHVAFVGKGLDQKLYHDSKKKLLHVYHNIINIIITEVLLYWQII